MHFLVRVLLSVTLYFSQTGFQKSEVAYYSIFGNVLQLGIPVLCLRCAALSADLGGLLIFNLASTPDIPPKSN